MRSCIASSVLAGLVSAAVVPAMEPRTYGHGHQKLNVQVGDRPYFLIDAMDEGPLKQNSKVAQSETSRPATSSSRIVEHRYNSPSPHCSPTTLLAARAPAPSNAMSRSQKTNSLYAATRHTQCDLHTTTNILNTTLAPKCTTPFIPYANSTAASAKCCTADLTLSEFTSLCGKMDSFNPNGTMPLAYMDGTSYFRTDLYASGCPTLMTLNSYIDVVDSWGLKYTPELKTPEVKMPFNGYTQEQYAQDLVNAFRAKKIAPSRVWLQSFLPADIFYWIRAAPEFGRQAVYLDERVDTPARYLNAIASIPELARRDVKVLAPAFFALTKVVNGQIAPSEYAIAAKKAGMELVGWSFECSGWLQVGGGGYYYQYVTNVTYNEGDMYTVLDVLAQMVGIKAMFSDWPATVTYYANCFGL